MTQPHLADIEEAKKSKTSIGPAAIILLAVFIVFALSLGRYCLHYFPYEDDFALIRYSTIQNSPSPATWISQGYSQYFANDPRCTTGSFGFVRPVIDVTYYVESLLSRSGEGPLLLATNIVSWLTAAWLLYGIARRLGASNWMASAAILLYATSPCWYRGLIHSSFRNNGLSACFILAATYVVLSDNAVRSSARLLAVGLLITLGAGCHEQALTSLPIFVLGVAWFSYQAESGLTRKMLVAVIAVLAPTLLMIACFRRMNPAYGTSYASSGFLSQVNTSPRLASHGIHSTLLISLIKLCARLLNALFSTLSALTPLGADNMARLNPHLGIVLFLLVAIAAVAVMKYTPRLILPIVAFVLYAVGRSVGIPFAEPRFTHLEVAWGVVVLVCALSAAFASRNRIAIATGVAAAIGLFAFNAVSYDATFLKRNSILMRRNEVDREAFQRIRAAASIYPGAQVVLSNDQAAMWGGRAMLELAGFKSQDFEILPTINTYPSIDVLRNVGACPVTSQEVRLPTTFQVRLFYAAGCSVSTFGRDDACTARCYLAEGRSSAAEWAACLDQTMDRGPCPSPLVDDVPILSERPLVLIAWRDRLSPPEIKVLPPMMASTNIHEATAEISVDKNGGRKPLR
jgi:hypothetical protein